MNESSIGTLPDIAAQSQAPLAPDHYGEEERGRLDIDLQAIWAAIYRNRFLIAAVIIAALLAGLAVTLLTRPTFRAVASVQIEQQSSKVLETQDEDTAGAIDAERFLQTQLDIIRSRSLAIRVGESLGLFRNNEFFVAMKVEPSAAPIGNLNLRDSQRERTISLLQRNLTVTLPRNSRIATIGFDSPNALLSARIANSYAQNYITSNIKRRFDTSAYARAFLERQLAQTKERLEDSERKMIAYSRSAQLIDASAGANTGANVSGPRSLTTANLVQLNESYAQARSARVAAEQRWNQARNTPLMTLPEVLTNQTIQELSRSRADLRAEYEKERQRRKEAYPSVMQAAAQLKELDGQILALATNIRTSIRNQYEIALKQEQDLERNVGSLKTETLAEQDRSIEYNILKREVDTNRSLYEALLQRFKELSAAAGITTSNISIIDSAEAPTGPISPRPFMNMALAGVAGVLLALMLVFIRERFDDAIRLPEDVDRKLDLPLLGTIPRVPGEITPLEALADQRSAFSEAYMALRTSFELASSGGLPRSIQITSSKQSEGKSTTAMAIARDFGRLGRKVLLVDGDLRKPSLHKLMSVPNDAGFANLLAGQAEFENVMRRSEMANLDFISTGPLPPNPADLLAGVRLGELLRQFERRYDLVVVDGPPVLGLADAPLISAQVDATAFVVQASGSKPSHAKAALRRLMSARARMLGVILTKFDARQAGYGDYSYAYYYYDYGNRPDEEARGKRFGRFG